MQAYYDLFQCCIQYSLDFILLLYYPCIHFKCIDVNGLLAKCKVASQKSVKLKKNTKNINKKKSRSKRKRNTKSKNP